MITFCGVRLSQGVLQPVARYNLTQGRGIVGWMRETGKSLLVRDFLVEMDSLPSKPRYLSDHPPRSAVFVPMVKRRSCDRRNGYPVGHPGGIYRVTQALALDHRQPGRCSNHECARAGPGTRARAQQLDLVNEVARQTAAILDPEELFPRLTSAIANTFNYYFVGLSLLDEETHKLIMRGATNPQMVGVQLELGHGLIGTAVQEQRMILADDTAHDSRYLSLGILPETRSEIVVPLLLNGNVIGAMDLQSEKLAAFLNTDKHYLEVHGAAGGRGGGRCAALPDGARTHLDVECVVAGGRRRRAGRNGGRRAGCGWRAWRPCFRVVDSCAVLTYNDKLSTFEICRDLWVAFIQ